MAKERYTVMVVDDVPSNISVLLDVLQSEFRLLVAESGESCLDQLPHAIPDLILLDVKMPGMDGFSLCEVLQADNRYQSIPVIFMTGVDEPEQKRRALELGAVDYVTNPIYVPEVEARVRTHLRLRMLQRELEIKNEQLEDEVAMRRETDAQLSQSLDQAIITAQEDGQVTFISRLAENLIQRYFQRSGVLMLPSEWVELAQRNSMNKADLQWEVEHPRSPTHLNVRLVKASSGWLFLISETGRRGPAPLAALGLSPREAEVLYWLAEGKANAEIATILGASVRTVHKHVENIYRKLKVESRSAAMRMALDVLDAW